MTKEKKEKKIKKRSSLKKEFIVRGNPQSYDEIAYLLKSPKSAISLLKRIKLLKEGKAVASSL